MAFTDPRDPPTGSNTENHQDVIPPTERNQDPVMTELTHGLTAEGSRPLTEQERKAADRDAPVGERVYAPASERVPVNPVPGHREVVEHPDTHTPEREAASQSTESSSSSSSSSEPSFTRVARPSTSPTPEGYASASTNPGWDTSSYGSSWNNTSQPSGWFGMRLGWLTLAICGGVGAWAWLRWQRERNKPINRLRRQARQAAEEIRERVPSPEDAARPAMGLTTAVLSILLVWWRQSQTRARHADKVMSRQATRAAKRADKAVGRASDALSDVDWYKRLAKLKDRWTPGRLQLEQISISRH
jgi:hypothetical protein